LLTKRRDILLQRVKSVALHLQFGEGYIRTDTLPTAFNQLLDAELQLAKTKEQRLIPYKRRLDNMRMLEHEYKIKNEDGILARHDVLWATALRLQAEIDLHREQHPLSIE
jgi:hypothetical protein